MKDFLKKLIKAKTEQAKNIRARIEDSQDVNEVRELGETLQKVLDELNDAKEQLAKAEDDKGDDKGNDPAPDPNAARSFNPLATYGIKGTIKRDGDSTDSMEYRSAFMNYVISGKPMPAELRADESTTTVDAATVIPTVLVNRIVEKMQSCGMILPLLTRTSYAAGIVVPTSSVRPVATWVAEGAGSDTQKKDTGKIVFSYFKLRCEISMSAEVGAMAVSAFEAAFVEQVSEAMTIAIEKAVIAGDGTSQPKGILKETAAATVEIAADVPTYKELCAIEAAVPVEYETSAKWFMTKAQFMKLVSMTDTAGQPVARVNYGIEGAPERTILGRDVVIHPYATEMGTVAAFIFDPKDYALNTIYDLGIQKKQDWDTEDLRTKAVMSVDGKALRADSLVTVTVKGA